MKAVFVVLASAPQRRAEVEAELVAAVDAADDPRELDGAHAQATLNQTAGTLGVLVETAQLATLDGVPAGVHQQHRAGRGAGDLIGHAAKHRARQHRTRVGAQDDQADIADQRLLDDACRWRADAYHALGVDAPAAQPRPDGVEVGPCDRFARQDVGWIHAAWAQDVQQQHVGVQGAGILLRDWDFDFACGRQVQGYQDGPPRRVLVGHG